MSESVTFAVGGAVQAKNGTYLKRSADDELLAACQAGDFAYILACRQIGKSSLMNETATRLAQEGVETIRLDLNAIGKTINKANDWYFNFIDLLARDLKLDLDVESWWEARPMLTATRRFLQFLRDVVMAQISSPIVIFVDEIDMMLGLTFADDFFAAIRTVYSNRAKDPDFRRLTFVLLGVAAPDELISDETRTPFNVGQAIALPDFTKAECAPFQQEIEAKYPTQGRDFFNQIYAWTGGHPYLTQKLCAALLSQSSMDNGEMVKQLVNKLFLTPEGRGDDNLQFVQSRIKDDDHAAAMLRVYKQVLQPEEYIADDEHSVAINRLKLYGLVISQNGRLRVRNPLYAHVFDAAWADDLLKSMRLGLPGDYSILQRIGQGDLTTVYLAQSQHAAEKDLVAFKVINLRQESEEEWDKWITWVAQHSAKIMALTHPHLIPVQEIDYNIDDRILFIAAQYVAGETLQDRLKRNSLSRSEAVEMIAQLGSALTFIHEQGVFHLGANPGNILLDAQTEPPRYLLINLGLVHLYPNDEYLPRHRTGVRSARQYMAPEQWRQPQALAPATDVYTLAVTFFEALAGRLPPNRQPGDPLPPLSQFNSDVGDSFDEILAKATAKNPADRFGAVAGFIGAIKTINDQVEQAERTERKRQAAQAIGLAQKYVQKKQYDPQKALSMVEIALELCPGYLDALRLRGKIQLEQDQLEAALADYSLAYEQTNIPTSEVGLEYLNLLSQTAEQFWRWQQFEQSVQHYATIRQILMGQADGVAPLQQINQQARTRLIDYYEREGNKAYALETPKDIDQAIKTLGRQVEQLEALQATQESAALQEKLKRLQIKKHQHTIQTAQAAIDEINTKGTQTRLGKEDILYQHYLAIDEAYKALLTIEPDHQAWQIGRHKKLKEWAESRQFFAIRALGQLDPDYEAALRHYKAILDLEQTRYPAVAQELGLNLDEKIAELTQKADHDGKYREIQELIDAGESLKALERLDQDFISERNYEHRDVARKLWGLVYAKQHHGEFPPEWKSLSNLNIVNERLVLVEKERLERLSHKLEPWSQARILETVEQNTMHLGELELQVKNVEESLDKAITYGVTDKAEVEYCRDDLAEVEAQIHKQRNLFFHIPVNETAQKVEAWLQKIDDVNSFLDNIDDTQEDIPTFFQQSDEALQAIEEHSTFKELQALEAANREIGRIIDQVKIRIKRRLIEVLIDDIGRRDERLAQLRNELAAYGPGVIAELRQSLEKTEKQNRMLARSIFPAMALGGVIGFLGAIATAGLNITWWVVAVGIIIIIFWLSWVGSQLRD